jgi:hypothetical protein
MAAQCLALNPEVPTQVVLPLPASGIPHTPHLFLLSPVLSEEESLDFSFNSTPSPEGKNKLTHHAYVSLPMCYVVRTVFCFVIMEVLHSHWKTI